MKRESATIPVYQVDAFAEKPFQGNPAAVCILNQVRTADWMQAVAAEMNLSETAFVRRVDEDYALRWFTHRLKWICADMRPWLPPMSCGVKVSSGEANRFAFTRRAAC